MSVTVGGKQYLLGLYDTAGQVSGLGCRLPPFLYSSCAGLRKTLEREAVGWRVCLRGGLPLDLGPVPFIKVSK